MFLTIERDHIVVLYLKIIDIISCPNYDVVVNTHETSKSILVHKINSGIKAKIETKLPRFNFIMIKIELCFERPN